MGEVGDDEDLVVCVLGCDTYGLATVGGDVGGIGGDDVGTAGLRY